MSNKTGARFSFLGTSRSIRESMCETIQEFAHARQLSTEVCTHEQQWQDHIARASVGMCPRGFGRTSYRLTETIQLGTVPWYVYDDVEWLPYRTLWSSLGFSSNIKHLKQDLHSWNNNQSTLDVKRSNVLRYKDSHFTYAGVLEQIRRFMVAPATSDLECQPHPRCYGSKTCTCPAERAHTD